MCRIFIVYAKRLLNDTSRCEEFTNKKFKKYTQGTKLDTHELLQHAALDGIYDQYK